MVMKQEFQEILIPTLAWRLVGGRECDIGFREVLGGGYFCNVQLHDCNVLDIGMAAGGFTLWAHYAWPRCRFFCYEPNAVYKDVIRKNIVEHQVNAAVFTSAVSSSERVVLQHEKGIPYGGSAIRHERWEGKELVEVECTSVVHPKDLPKADVVKVDTEGNEEDILFNYPHLDSVQLILYEYHSSDAQIALMDLMRDKFDLLKTAATEPQVGEMFWLNKQYDDKKVRFLPYIWE